MSSEENFFESGEYLIPSEQLQSAREVIKRERLQGGDGFSIDDFKLTKYLMSDNLSKPSWPNLSDRKRWLEYWLPDTGLAAFNSVMKIGRVAIDKIDQIKDIGRTILGPWV